MVFHAFGLCGISCCLLHIFLMRFAYEIYLVDFMLFGPYEIS
jgi:hypothetical protein